jgi:hypothetical protein
MKLCKLGWPSPIWPSWPFRLRALRMVSTCGPATSVSPGRATLAWVTVAWDCRDSPLARAFSFVEPLCVGPEPSVAAPTTSPVHGGIAPRNLELRCLNLAHHLATIKVEPPRPIPRSWPNHLESNLAPPTHRELVGGTRVRRYRTRESRALGHPWSTPVLRRDP